MSKNNTFYLSERYISKMYKDIVLNELMTFVFYFVFNILFQKHPLYNIIKPALGSVFAVIAIVLLFLGNQRAKKTKSICYLVKKDGLEYNDGKTVHFYPWNSFTNIKRNPNLISRVYPVEFYVTNEKFTLHRQLDAPDALITAIEKHTGLKVEE